MPLPKFDNLGDVTAKFVGTICYYDNEPVTVKTAFHADDDPNQFLLSVAEYGKESKIVDVHDPKFRYRDYVLGYCNTNTATWWYRRPARQYQQGLKPDQMRFYSETGYGQPKAGFLFNKTSVLMLKNEYMSLEEAKKLTRDGKLTVAAWHRDFAVQWDPVSPNYFLEYRASRIGILGAEKFGSASFPILSPDAYYVKEALQEALGQ